MAAASLGLFAALLAPSVQAQATPVYSEEFTNTLSSGNMYLSNFGWNGYRDAIAANLSASNVYIPQNLGNPDTQKGYLTLAPGMAGTFAVVKTLAGLNAAGCEFTWSMGNNLTTPTVRILVKVGANWYASSEVFSNTSTYTPTTFASTTTGDVRRSLVFSTAAANWRSFTLTPGSAMSLGAAPGSNLASSQITGIGFYATTPTGAPVLRIDSLKVTPLTPPEPVYSEEFTNTLSSGNMYLSNFGWNGYRHSNAANLSASNVYIPQNLGNPDTQKGYLTLAPGTAGTFAVVKTLSSLDVAGCAFTWSMGNNLTTPTVHILVKVGANWYASSDAFSNTSTYTPTTFASTTTGDVRRLLVFSTAAANWRSFTLVPGSAMSLGAALGSNLSSSQITGIGFYATTPAGSPVVRLDSLEVTPYSAPLPPGAAELGYTKIVIDERPKLADIAPGKTGNYKWFRGATWTPTQPPLSNFTETNGVLTILQKADGTTNSLVGAPHDFVGGVFPRLLGSEGFYIEFEVSLSSNNTDHWPAVWLMPAEHNGGNSFGQPLGDVYPNIFPNDPPGYERWMELDVDEGGFRPGMLGSVISWEGQWTPGGYPQPVISNSWAAGGAALDRTQRHVFGASYDPIQQRVTWWLDGVKFYTADNTVLAGCISPVAELQSFYPILGAQAHGPWKTTPTPAVPYSMYIHAVRAYTPE